MSAHRLYPIGHQPWPLHPGERLLVDWSVRAGLHVRLCGCKTVLVAATADQMGRTFAEHLAAARTVEGGV